ncbi:hypothetical protein U9M48_022301 [Paspalum notatum var. saurae]|uniref:Uncharacterized protein n=1 Tax=Paspalum notatum var. saurae TaxID=547442 RepID=A0AAQ3TJL2_PASNO
MTRAANGGTGDWRAARSAGTGWSSGGLFRSPPAVVRIGRVMDWASGEGTHPTRSTLHCTSCTTVANSMGSRQRASSLDMDTPFAGRAAATPVCAWRLSAAGSCVKRAREG